MEESSEPTGSTDPGELPEHAVVGGYRLVQRLGEGGMGVVHLALDRQGRAVALKMLRPLTATDADARARLRREVDALGRIESPRVAPIIDAELDGAHPFVVTRWVPGPALDDVVEERGPLSGVALHVLAVGLAEGIEATHAAGVVHRDIKPGNVLLLDGEPVLIDFGIAHLTDDVRLTGAGLVMGTPGYLAPEIVEGAPVGRATDWWGWAATLAYAASGRPPFGRGAMDAVLARVARGEPDLDGVDPRLAPLLLAALAPRAEDRPHQQEVVRALEVHARGGDVTDVIRTRPAAAPTQSLATGGTEVLPQARPLPPPPSPTSSSWRAPAPAPPAVAAARTGAPLPPPAPVATRGPGSPVPGPAPSPAPPLAQRPLAGPPAAKPAYAAPPVPPRDPRIGLPLRTSSVSALLGLGIVGAAVAPTWTLLVLAVLVALARSVDRAMTSLILRRHQRGQRPSDLPITAAIAPWHVVLGALSGVASLLLPLVVAAAAVFATSLVLSALTGVGSPNGFLPLAVGGLFGLLMAWWGPGGASLRRGTRSCLRGATPGRASEAALVGVVALVAAALLLWGLLAHGSPSWSPVSDPSRWTFFGP